MASILPIILDLTVVGQPSCCMALHAAGWRFSYSAETRLVSAEHPLGGKQSVVEVSSIGRTGFDAEEIGNAIAMMLNGGKHDH